MGDRKKKKAYLQKHVIFSNENATHTFQKSYLKNFMEILFLLTASLSFLLFIIFIFMFMFNTKNLKKSNPITKLPPGPRPLPIIGNLHQLSGPLPHHTLTDLAKEYGPLMHLKLGEVSTVVVSSPEVAKEVMSDHDLIFAYRPYTLCAEVLYYKASDIAFSPYGDYWRQVRKICTVEVLSSKRVQTFRSIREEEVLDMIRSIHERKELTGVNLTRMIFLLTYNITAQAAFGKKTRHQEEFVTVMEDVIKFVGGFTIVDMYPSIKVLELITGMRQKLQRTHEKIDRIVGTVLKEHREETRKSKNTAEKDLVDVLLKIQSCGDFGIPLTDDNIKAIIFDVFSAGGETSSTTSVWAMSEMIKNPKVLVRAQEEVRSIYNQKGNVDESRLNELKYLQAVIKETMRLHPAVPLLLPRECSKNCKIYGYDIPAKTRVIVNGRAINRDPKHWTDPEEFNPNRFLDSEFDFKGTYFSYIPFGAGRRICPGISFALPNVELPLAQLLFHFDWKLPVLCHSNVTIIMSSESSLISNRTDTDHHQYQFKYQRSKPCMICNKADVTVVFLPCAHQVVCSKCHEEVYDALEGLCPCCKDSH